MSLMAEAFTPFYSTDSTSYRSKKDSLQSSPPMATVSETSLPITDNDFSVEDVQSKFEQNLESNYYQALQKIQNLELELKQVKAEKNTYSESLKESVEMRADLEVSYNKLQSEFDHYKTSVVGGLEAKNQALQEDMERLAEKLIDETERRSELIHAKQLLEAELEDLSQNLFEEANKMVSDERRINKELEDRLIKQESKYEDVKILLDSEKEQCQELKARLGDLMDEKDAAASQDIEPAGSPALTTRSRRSLSVSTTPVARSIHSSDSGYRGANTQSSDHDLFTASNSALSFHSNDHRFHEFKEFLDAPTNKGLYLASKFMKRSLSEDVDSALRFDSSMLSGWMTQKRILAAAQLGNINIYPFKGDISGAPPSPAQCSFCTSMKSLLFQYNITGGDIEPRLICLQCRDRLLAVCKFFAFLRMIRAGVIKGSPQKLYLDCLQAKHLMFLARVGAAFAPVEEQVDPMTYDEPEVASVSVTTSSEISSPPASGPPLPSISIPPV